MVDNQLATKIFKNREYMTQEQQGITEEFQEMVEAEYALCTSQMKRANEAAMSGAKSSDPQEKLSINCACLEVDAIREYWFNRLVAMVQIIEHRNPSLAKQLAKKYLINEQ